MTTAELIRLRLRHQRLVGSTCRTPPDVVATLGAMQAQEYAMAKWAIGLRLPGATDADVERAFNTGAILRTHLLRPTWHFVAPADIRWLLALTKPRIQAAMAYMDRKLELTPTIFRRGERILARALAGGEPLDRDAVRTALGREGVKLDGPRLGHVLMRAELEALICSGPRVGRQFTYALLEQRVPRVKALTRDAALGELARRYFASRGPATVHDFAGWSMLTVADAKAGAAMLGHGFTTEEMDGRTYIFSESPRTATRTAAPTWFAPDYDEYGMGYKDRAALFDPAARFPASFGEDRRYGRVVVTRGRFSGAWRREETKDAIEIEAVAYQTWDATTQRELARAADRLGKFVGKEPRLTFRSAS